MLDRKPDPATGATEVGAYEAKTKFSELIARAEKGESFVITKNGRPVARILPTDDADRARKRAAVEELRRFLEAQGPRVSEEESQRNWEELKRAVDAEDDEHDERMFGPWTSSSTPR